MQEHDEFKSHYMNMLTVTQGFVRMQLLGVSVLLWDSISENKRFKFHEKFSPIGRLKYGMKVCMKELRYFTRVT